MRVPHPFLLKRVGDGPRMFFLEFFSIVALPSPTLRCAKNGAAPITPFLYPRDRWGNATANGTSPADCTTIIK